MSSLAPASTILAAASKGWLTPDTLRDLLLYYHSHYGLRVFATKPKPQPGFLYLCDKTSMPDWYADGLNWNLTGKGLLAIQNTPRLRFIQHQVEHQEKRFSRRASWLLDRENIILVQYLATPTETLPKQAVLSSLMTPSVSSLNIMHTHVPTTMMGNTIPSPFTTSTSTSTAFTSPSVTTTASTQRLTVSAVTSTSSVVTPSQTPTHSQRPPSPCTDDSTRPLKRANTSSGRSPTERFPMRRETDVIMQTMKSSSNNTGSLTTRSTGDDKTDRILALEAENKKLKDTVNRLKTQSTPAEIELLTRRTDEPNVYPNERLKMISDLSKLLEDTQDQDESVETSNDIIPLIQRLDHLQKMRWVGALQHIKNAIECLDPSPLARVAVHGLDQNDDCYAPNASFHTLFRECSNVAPAKIQEIMSLRSSTSPIRSAHDQLVSGLQTVYTTALHHLALLQKHYDTFCSHLTPTQIARIHVTLHNRPYLLPRSIHSQQQP